MRAAIYSALSKIFRKKELPVTAISRIIYISYPRTE